MGHRLGKKKKDFLNLPKVVFPTSGGVSKTPAKQCSSLNKHGRSIGKVTDNKFADIAWFSNANQLPVISLEIRILF